MKKFAKWGVLLLLVAGTAIAVRYQPYAIHRLYYADASKTVLVGRGYLSCPTYNSIDAWQYDGKITAFYTDTNGQACTTGGATGPWCPAGSDPLLCT